MAKVVIIVPGIMGSVLMLGNEIIWPGPVNSLIFPYKKMKELLDPRLIATDVIREYFITDQYKQLIDDLERWDFHEDDGTLIAAAYDWREDNAVSAQTLAMHIDKAVQRHGPKTEIVLIAHSMGGLVSRYYLESGDFKKHGGFSCVRTLITIGTPHRGAAVALPVVLGHEKRMFLSKEQVHQAARDTRYPSSYQLLPPQGERFVWNRANGSLLNDLDIYDKGLAKKLALVEENLDSAKNFHSKLNTANKPDNVRYFCFSGTRQTTATHVLCNVDATKALIDKVELDDGGDGTVPTWSSFLPSPQRMFVGGEHGTLYKSKMLRDTMAVLLGVDDLYAGVPENVEVAVRDRVAEPDDLVHVSIGFPSSVDTFEGVLTLEKAILDENTGAVVSYGEPILKDSIVYKGLGLETMSLVFSAPEYRGVYRVGFRDRDTSNLSGFDELIVQEPAQF